MLSEKQKEIVNEVINIFIEDTPFTIESINEGSCAEFAQLLNEEYFKSGLNTHKTYDTYDFISPEADQDGACEYMKDWKEESMTALGIPADYFKKYKKEVETYDSRGLVGYHVWLFDGEHHYDATCIEGVKNPLELPFFQLFTKERNEKGGL